MASKNGALNLPPDDRAKLLVELQRMGEITRSDLPEPTQQELETAIQKFSSSSALSVANSPSGATYTFTTNNSKDNHGNILDESFERNNKHLMKENFGTGCLCCGEDDDHANLLLCEGCNAEYHTYCCEPPLRQVPSSDWYCSSCKSIMAIQSMEDDGMDRMISAMSPSFTSRFGEVCWAHGGQGFGWWPAFIYDPRFTSGNARDLARKNLGKRHLVYFFECHETPFAVLTSAKLAKWDDGLMEDYHMGKMARSAGKLRLQSFLQAMQAAALELAKPIEMRMDWNHTELPQILPSPEMKNVKPPSFKRKRKQTKDRTPGQRDDSPSSSTTNRIDVALISKQKKKNKREGKRVRGFPLMYRVPIEGLDRPLKKNLMEALAVVKTIKAQNANTISEPGDDGELFVKLLLKLGGIPMENDDGTSATSSIGKQTPTTGSYHNHPGSKSSKNVGFLKLRSRKTNTFADARLEIEKELESDGFLQRAKWKFFVPGLGPVSSRQETSLGPMFGFLRQTTTDVHLLGDGTTLHPLKVFIVDVKNESL